MYLHIPMMCFFVAWVLGKSASFFSLVFTPFRQISIKMRKVVEAILILEIFSTKKCSRTSFSLAAGFLVLCQCHGEEELRGFYYYPSLKPFIASAEGGVEVLSNQ